MIAFETILTNKTGTFPNTLAINASSPGATTGTEMVAGWLNEFFGERQAFLSAAGLTPSGVAESSTVSQSLQAHQIMFGVPGDLVLTNVANTASLGYPSGASERILVCTGQTILISNYPNLAANTYCGDANNANTAYQFFYKCVNSDGTSRNVNGPYFKLPDYRGVFLQGLDLGALRNPNGATQYNGNYLADAMQGHFHPQSAYTQSGAFTGIWSSGAVGSLGTSLYTLGPSTDGSHGTPRTDSDTRPRNCAVTIGIRY